MLLGGSLGFLWAVGVVWLGVHVINIPIFALTPVLYVAFLGPGLVTGLMVFWVAMRRFRAADSDTAFAPEPGTPSWIDDRVLRNTIEQLVLALCLWPAIGFLAADDGPGLLVALSVAFVIARLAFWIGYRRALPLRLFGWAATFYATLLALFWAVAVWFF